MRKVTLKELEQAQKILAHKRLTCGDGLLQEALEVAECLIITQLSLMKVWKIEYITVEDIP